MLTTSERFEKFDADLAKIKSNREKIPLEQLTTRYAKAYNALVADLEEFAEWFTGEYIKTLAIPRHPKAPQGRSRECLASEKGGCDLGGRTETRWPLPAAAGCPDR